MVNTIRMAAGEITVSSNSSLFGKRCPLEDTFWVMMSTLKLTIMFQFHSSN